MQLFGSFSAWVFLINQFDIEMGVRSEQVDPKICKR
jgi:hypothetical protein